MSILDTIHDLLTRGHHPQPPQKPIIDYAPPQLQQQMQQVPHYQPKPFREMLDQPGQQAQAAAMPGPMGRVNAQGQTQWNPYMGGAPQQPPAPPPSYNSHTLSDAQNAINQATGMASAGLPIYLSDPRLRRY